MVARKESRPRAHQPLNQEFAWKCIASNLTGHLYTNLKMFTHTAADRAPARIRSGGR